MKFYATVSIFVLSGVGVGEGGCGVGGWCGGGVGSVWRGGGTYGT